MSRGGCKPEKRTGQKPSKCVQSPECSWIGGKPGVGGQNLWSGGEKKPPEEKTLREPVAELELWDGVDS